MINNDLIVGETFREDIHSLALLMNELANRYYEEMAIRFENIQPHKDYKTIAACNGEAVAMISMSKHLEAV